MDTKEHLCAGTISRNASADLAWLEGARAAGLTPVVAGDSDPPGAGSHSPALLARSSVTYCGAVDGEPVLLAAGGNAFALNGAAGRLAPKDLAERIVRGGAAALASIGGSFFVVVLLPARGEAWLAVDRFAVGNLYYIEHNGALAFSNRTAFLASYPACDNAFRAQSIYDYLYFHSLPGNDAGYAAMSRLEPGHYLHWRDGRAETRSYWVPGYSIDRTSSEAAFAEDIRQSLAVAVEREIHGRNEVGCFLSGGLDSSTVTGLAAAAAASNVTAFTIGFDSPGYDEMAFARTAATHFGVRHVPYYVTPEDVVTALPEIANAFDGPFGNASAVPAYYCAKLAADAGMDVILAGDGGDELFGGNKRYAKQLLFEKYTRVPAWMRRGLVEPAARITPPPVGRKVSRYIEQANIPLPDRLMTYNLLETVDAASFLTPDFLAQVDTSAPIAYLRSLYAASQGEETLNRMLRLDLGITLSDSDLPKVARTCDLAGIRVAFPMLDEGLFAVSARLPSAMKVKSGELRYLFKRAFADLLPESTLNKSKHGFGLPFGNWLETDPALQELVAENLSVLQRAGILREGFRNEFLNGAFQEHAAYYGTLLWVLMSLGLWLEQRGVTI